jgi:hypothetical protein
MINPLVRFDKDRVMAIPCGLSARSTFDDSFVLFRCTPQEKWNCQPTAENTVKIDRKDIAWDSDLEDRYKNIDV